MIIMLKSDNKIISTETREEKITSLAREEGKEEGIEEGIKIGREKAIKEGAYQIKINIAKNLLKRNMKIKDILEITGLSEEDIKPLQKFC